VADKKFKGNLWRAKEFLKVGPAADHVLKVDPWWAENFNVGPWRIKNFTSWLIPNKNPKPPNDLIITKGLLVK